jgi:hypothetical protein
MDIDLVEGVLDPYDQSEIIPTDVENCPLIHSIGCWKIPTDVFDMLPLCFRGDPVPGPERRFGLGMS